MLTLIPIFESDADQPYRDFFEPEFVSQRLGRRGTWYGAGARRLGLKQPAKLTVFENLLHGRNPNGVDRLAPDIMNSRAELGWRLTISAPPTLSLLWAVFDREHRVQIEQCFLSSIRYPLQNFERSFSHHEKMGIPKPIDNSGVLLAKFRAGATPEQRPFLHTTLFLLNLDFRADGTIGRFSHDQVCRRADKLKAQNEKSLNLLLWDKFGLNLQLLEMENYQRGELQGMSRGFFYEPRFPEWLAKRPGEIKQPLRSDQLFNAWQDLAGSMNWGPEDTPQFLQFWRGFRQSMDSGAATRRLAHAGYQKMQLAKDSLKRLISSRTRTPPNQEPPDHEKNKGMMHSH